MSSDDMQAELDGLRMQFSDIENDIGRIAYKGNSVAHWHSKAVAYKNALDDAWAALRERGIHSDGQTDVAAAIRKLVKAE